MKLQYLLILFLFTSGMVSCQNGDKEMKKEDLSTLTHKISYAIGLDVGRNLKAQGIEVSYEAFLQGLKDAVNDTTLLDSNELNAAWQEYKAEMMKKENEPQTEEEKKLKAEADKWLEENAKKEGIKATDSGLQYKVITEGTGKSPSQNNEVTVHYKGTLIDGTQFDSSYDRGEPTTFGVSNVIPGWTEALMMMKEGGKWELFIAPELAYGKRGAGQQIPPYAALIFEVELIEVK